MTLGESARAVPGLSYPGRFHARLPLPDGRVNLANCLRGIPILELLQPFSTRPFISA